LIHKDSNGLSLQKIDTGLKSTQSTPQKMGKEGSEVLDAICSLQVLYVGIN
jgi:hypothetical protein